MDLYRSMETFSAVVEHNGFAAAGKSLGLSKTVVSRMVSGLEDHLGVRLLQRSTRRLSLTEEGERYLEHARNMLEENNIMECELGERRATPRGRLRINAPSAWGERYLGPLLPEFMARYPDIAIEVSLTNRFVDLIEDGFDVAIRIGGNKQSNLIARKLGTIDHGIYASPDYLAEHGRPETIADFKTHKCLSYMQSGRVNTWQFRGRSFTPRAILLSDNGEVLRDACKGGAGLISLPSFYLTDEVETGALVNLEPDCPGLTSDLLAVYPERRHLALKVRVFVDYLVEVLG